MLLLYILLSCSDALEGFAAQQAMEKAATAWATEKMKKRPAIGVGKYELKRIQRGTQDDLLRDSPQMELVATLTGSLGVVP